ncbi:ribose import binding protein RbsB [Abditibacteriota bacterium]|nr:ribose import binding protein RbsB [Abditibacteriota bacterium]
MAFLSAGCPGTTPDNTAAPTDNTAMPGNSAMSSTTPPTGGKTFKLAFVTNNPSDYWTVARKGVEKAEKELGIKVDYQIPAGGTAAEQTTIINDLLSKGTQGIAMSPVDPANQTELINSTAAKALVFTQDSDAPKSNRACYIGTDNVAAGRQAGDELKKALPGGGKVMIFVGKKDAQNAADRINGLKEAIKGTKIEVIDTRTDDADRTRAKANVSDAITKYPDLAACVGIWSYNGPGILSAVQDASKVGKIKIVCFDEEDDTLTGVKSGAISATVVQQPFEFGYMSIINMNKYLNGDKSVIPASKQNYIKTRVITAATVDDFRTNLKKLRGK